MARFGLYTGLTLLLCTALLVAFETAQAQVSTSGTLPSSAPSKTEPSQPSDSPLPFQPPSGNTSPANPLPGLPGGDTTSSSVQKTSPQSTPQSRNEAQGILQPSRAPLQPNENFQFFGSLRARIENYSYFAASKANGAYTYGGTLLRFGIRRDMHRDDFLLELAQPTLIGLPTNANAPNPQGALGQGANYFASNGGHVASLFPKQLYERFKQLGDPANSLRLGRFEFIDGGEYRPDDLSLAYLKQNRVNNRLISTNPFSFVGHSYDGLEFTNQTADHTSTFMASLPTRGSYDLNGSDTLTDIKVVYLASTLPRASRSADHVSDSRLFGIFYEDTRGSKIVKTDNRPLSIRQKDGGAIDIGTFGGHDIRLFPVGRGRMDTLVWMAGQVGKWGEQNQGAYAADLEIGYQPRDPRLHSWFRSGYYYGSGDGNPNNNQHGTFFPMLPSGRTYARFPFFATSNLQDAFGEVILRPTPKILIRSDVRKLALADNHDLYYSGSGAYNNSNFGFTGRTSTNSHDLATLLDTSLDYQISSRTLLIFYVAYASGGKVLSSIYKGSNANFAYMEFQRRF